MCGLVHSSISGWLSSLSSREQPQAKVGFPPIPDIWAKVRFRPIADIRRLSHRVQVSEKRELTTSERRQAGCGCFILTILFVVACFYSLGDAICETTTYTESLSPSGATDARVQMTDCGATTGFSRVVWVQTAWLPRDRAISCRAVALKNQPSVNLNWTAEALIVTTDAPQTDVMASASSCYGWPVELRHAPGR